MGKTRFGGLAVSGAVGETFPGRCRFRLLPRNFAGSLLSLPKTIGWTKRRKRMKRSLALLLLPLAFCGCASWYACPAEAPVAAAPAPPAVAEPATPAPKPEPAHPKPPAKVGAYSEQIAIDPEQRDVFVEATKESEARALRPLTVATQVVAGLNYDFRCVSADGLRRYSVVIHRPLPQTGETPRVVSIRELSATD